MKSFSRIFVRFYGPSMGLKQCFSENSLSIGDWIMMASKRIIKVS